jgi:hypothetical protein
VGHIRERSAYKAFVGNREIKGKRGRRKRTGVYVKIVLKFILNK